MKRQKFVVVTGAAKSGIGEALTHLLLKKGYRVVGTYEPEDAGRTKAMIALKGAALTLHKVNHADRASLAKFATSVTGPIDALINAQFTFEMENPTAYDHDLWDRLIAINLTAPNFLSRELEPKIVTGGSIVTITSTEGFIGSFGGAAYSACKAAMHNLIKTHANNFGSRGIRVNAVAGGWIGGVEDTDEIFNKSREITPLGRLGTGTEIAEVVLFLISKKASFINGTVITADGGYSGVDTLAKYEYEEFRNGLNHLSE
jgi:NAD(P)-dependent dehydrogenase (short-subunit alcohol dehydrogenase family)